MDKAVMKVLFRARGLPVCDWQVVRRREWRTSPRTVGAAVEIPARLSRFRQAGQHGVQRGDLEGQRAPELGAALDQAVEFDRKVVVEAAVADAREIECAVLGNEAPEASVPGEIVPSREFYDYQAKYIDGHSRLEIPAVLEEAQAREVRSWPSRPSTPSTAPGLARSTSS